MDDPDDSYLTTPQRLSRPWGEPQRSWREIYSEYIQVAEEVLRSEDGAEHLKDGADSYKKQARNIAKISDYMKIHMEEIQNIPLPEVVVASGIKTRTLVEKSLEARGALADCYGTVDVAWEAGWRWFPRPSASGKHVDRWYPPAPWLGCLKSCQLVAFCKQMEDTDDDPATVVDVVMKWA